MKLRQYIFDHPITMPICMFVGASILAYTVFSLLGLLVDGAKP